MKIIYFKSQLEAIKHNIKYMLQVIRSAKNKTNDKSNVPQILKLFNMCKQIRHEIRYSITSMMLSQYIHESCYRNLSL